LYVHCWNFHDQWDISSISHFLNFHDAFFSRITL
jgi:hypothetical protein